MYFSKDMKELLRLFDKYGVEYLLVGGFAVNYYGYVRMTQDIDFLINPSKDNARRMMRCLSDFGFGAAGISEELFKKEGSAIHLGVEPNRIDLLTKLKGLSNDTLFSQVNTTEIDGVGVKMITLENLLGVKKASGRLRDQADADELAALLD